jgi:transcriptional regulator with XRE-family HTH domain
VPDHVGDEFGDTELDVGAGQAQVRELAGLTLEQLAEGSFRGVPFLSQIERGERRMPLDLARHVDKVLETDGFFERRCEDARRARQSGHAEYFADVAEMERHAETIEEWAPHLMPGLLQTRAYAQKVVKSGRPWLRCLECPAAGGRVLAPGVAKLPWGPPASR